MMLLLFSISLFGILLVFIGYPALLLVLAEARPRPHQRNDDIRPRVVLIVACHNPGELLQRKIENSLALDYPEDKLSLLIVSDGSNDGTAERLQQLGSERVRGISLERHDGKAAALNAGIDRATQEATADILLFSDVDAELPPDTLRILVRHFAEPSIGGVCGQRVLTRGQAALHEAQASYVNWDSRIKVLESRIGSTTSNDGKLYALRREAAGSIADGVTDDLYAALGVIGRGWRFIFEPQALAWIPTPAKSAQHEISRRRRVVSRSLRGIYLRREVLNPGGYGFYAIALLVNKVLRPLLPLLLVMLLASTLLMAADSHLFATLAVLQLLVYGLVSASALGWKFPGQLGSIASRGQYALLGMLGTALGVWDFLRGRTVTRWQPSKDQPTQASSQNDSADS
jgi:cellulose synthase/poly-beta-1,6-N-acetylglucosamine synthase-like glycosyltransferase